MPMAPYEWSNLRKLGICQEVKKSGEPCPNPAKEEFQTPAGVRRLCNVHAKPLHRQQELLDKQTKQLKAWERG